jgi:hypothetical protein
MDTIVIKPKNKRDIEFWLNLAKRTGNKAKTVNEDDLEDFLFGKLIEKDVHSGTLSEQEKEEFVAGLRTKSGK